MVCAIREVRVRRRGCMVHINSERKSENIWQAENSPRFTAAVNQVQNITSCEPYSCRLWNPARRERHGDGLPAHERHSRHSVLFL